MQEHYQEDPPEENLGPARAFLEEYSHIPRDQADAHLLAIVSVVVPHPRSSLVQLLTGVSPQKRDRLWAVAKYRCIGRLRFASVPDADMADDGFREALRRLKSRDSQDVLLDLACCVGQVIRKLVHDGVDSTRLLGADLHPEFIDIGYELFRDRDRLGATFVAGDIFDADDVGFAKVAGKPTIVHAQAFFHLFDWQRQVAAAERVVELLRPGTSNAMIFGSQMGNLQPGEIPNIHGGTRFVHNQESFQRLWDEVGAKTGTKWRVDAELEARAQDDQDDKETRRRRGARSFRFRVCQAA